MKSESQWCLCKHVSNFCHSHKTVIWSWNISRIEINMKNILLWYFSLVVKIQTGLKNQIYCCVSLFFISDFLFICQCWTCNWTLNWIVALCLWLSSVLVSNATKQGWFLLMYNVWDYLFMFKFKSTSSMIKKYTFNIKFNFIMSQSFQYWNWTLIWSQYPIYYIIGIVGKLRFSHYTKRSHGVNLSWA